MMINGIYRIPAPERLKPTPDLRRVNAVELPSHWQVTLKEEASNAAYVQQQLGEDAFDLFIDETFQENP